VEIVDGLSTFLSTHDLSHIDQIQGTLLVSEQ
jgi:hypothetical protein